MIQDKLDKAYFQHDMAYQDFKELTWREAADKVLSDKIFNIAKNPKYDRYQSGLASMVYKFLLKRLLLVQSKMKLYLTKNWLKIFTI